MNTSVCILLKWKSSSHIFYVKKKRKRSHAEYLGEREQAPNRCVQC